MATIISIATQKGGVGKTTTAVNLACALASDPYNKRVLVIDMDPQSNASMTLGVKNPSAYDVTVSDIFDAKKNLTLYLATSPTKYKNVYLIPSTLDLFVTGIHINNSPEAVLGLRNAIDQTSMDAFDFIIIDNQPNLGGPFVVNSLVISDYIIIPVESASLYSLVGIDQFLESIEKLKKCDRNKMIILGVLITKIDLRTKASSASVEMIIRKFGDKVFKTRIQRNANIERANLTNKAVVMSDPKAIGAQNYMSLAGEVIERLKNFQTIATETNITE